MVAMTMTGWHLIVRSNAYVQRHTNTRFSKCSLCCGQIWFFESDVVSGILEIFTGRDAAIDFA